MAEQGEDLQLFLAVFCNFWCLTAESLMGQLLVASFSVAALFQASGSKILNSVCHSTDTDLEE